MAHCQRCQQGPVVVPQLAQHQADTAGDNCCALGWAHTILQRSEQDRSSGFDTQLNSCNNDLKQHHDVVKIPTYTYNCNAP
jgi:hypothetical protein